MGNKIYVTVLVNIPTLIKSLKKNIDAKAVLAENIKLSSPISRFKNTQKLYGDIIYTQNAIKTLEAVDTIDSLTNYIKIFYNLEMNFTSLSNGIKIYIDESNRSFFYPPLKNNLQQRYTLAKSLSDANIIVKITNNSFEESQDKLSNYIINADITVTFTEVYSRRILNQTFKITGKSGFGRQAAIDKALKDFSFELDEPNTLIEEKTNY